MQVRFLLLFIKQSYVVFLLFFFFLDNTSSAVPVLRLTNQGRAQKKRKKNRYYTGIVTENGIGYSGENYSIPGKIWKFWHYPILIGSTEPGKPIRSQY